MKFFQIFCVIFLLLTLPSELLAQEDPLKKINEVLQKKKQSMQPFGQNNSKVDLESLGLDNVDKKPLPEKINDNQAATKTAGNQSAANQEQPKMLIKEDAKQDTQNLNPTKTASQPPLTQAQKDSTDSSVNSKASGQATKAATKKDIANEAQIEAEKSSQSSKIKAGKTNLESDENLLPSDSEAAKSGAKAQESSDPVVLKSKKPGCVVKKEIAPVNFNLPKKVVKSSSKIRKKFFKKPTKKPEKTAKFHRKKLGFSQETEGEQQDKSTEISDNLTSNEIDIQKRAAELENLQKLYLQDSAASKDRQAIDDDFSAESPIVPRKKDLNNFTVEELPPIPILNRARSYDNVHIPFILTPKEKIDIMFSAISMGSITFFNEAFKYVQNPNIYNDQGDTILTYSLLIKKYPVAASVLAKGADPNLPNKLGHTPIGIAIEMVDFKALELLANNNANLKYVDSFGRTYLMHAARVGFLPAVDLLVKRGVDLNAMDEDGFTALAIAYRHKKELIAQYLLKNGAKTWEEKSFAPSQNLIYELENRWR